MSFQVGERVRVIGNLPQKVSFVGREGVVSGVAEAGGATRVTLDDGKFWLFWPTELARIEDVRPLVDVLRSDPDYVIDLRQFGDGDHSPLRLTQAETDRLIGALIAAVDG